MMANDSILCTAPGSTLLFFSYSIFTKSRSDQNGVLLPHLSWSYPIFTSQPRQSSKAFSRPSGWWIVYYPTTSFPHTKPCWSVATLLLFYGRCLSNQSRPSQLEPIMPHKLSRPDFILSYSIPLRQLILQNCCIVE